MNQTHATIAQLKARAPLPPLYPTKVWNRELSTQIQQQAGLSAAVRSGLLLWNDDLDASHTLSQDIHDSTGSYWHAIMHRREGDAGNSKYWWRRTGAHPAFDAVQQAVSAVLENETAAAARNFAAELQRSGKWQPERFVDACSAGSDRDEWLLRVQAAEMETLLNWCIEHDA